MNIMNIHTEQKPEKKIETEELQLDQKNLLLAREIHQVSCQNLQLETHSHLQNKALTEPQVVLQLAADGDGYDHYPNYCYWVLSLLQVFHPSETSQD